MYRPALNSLLFQAMRAGFRALPLSDATRDRWRDAFLDRFPRVRPRRRVPLGIAPVPRTRLDPGGPAIGRVAYRTIDLPSPLPARLVAFYLPQFHPIPENDAAWGDGYTEWTAVLRAQPEFDGHVQPRLPGALGTYDLRDVDVMRKQAKLAQDYGIAAFCFYFYWFHGRTLLEQPLRNWLAARDITLPYCLCWANEAWTRTWDGRAGEVLIPQSHDADDDVAFIAHVADYLRDPRCLRVDGKPVLLVYRAGKLPDARATAARWRSWCRANGIGDIHLLCVQSFERLDPRAIGFDAAVEFPPNLATLRDLTGTQVFFDADFAGELRDWRDLPAQYLNKAVPDYPLQPAVNAGWDNAPRRPGRGRTLLHASPRGYRDWLRATIAQRLPALQAKGASDLVFINAWNEWGEGAVLEPDARLDHAWLGATRAALLPQPSATRDHDACAVVHAWYPEVLGELLGALQASGLRWRTIITTAPEKREAVEAVVRKAAIAADIEVHANRGRDILPFLRVANRLLDDGEDIVLKLHTKQSTHRGDGDAWRREFLALLVDGGNARRIRQHLDAHHSAGLVAPAAQMPPLTHYWGANAERVDYLRRRLGLDRFDAEQGRFAAGSMFWCRLQALRPLLDAHLDEAEFEDETGQLDGTMAHAIERILLACVEQAGYRVQPWPAGTPLPDRSRYARVD